MAAPAGPPPPVVRFLQGVGGGVPAQLLRPAGAIVFSPAFSVTPNAGSITGPPSAPSAVTGYHFIDFVGANGVPSTPTPSAIVTTTDGTKTAIGAPIAVPASSPVSVLDITFALIGYDVTNAQPFVLRRIVTVGRIGSGTVMLLDTQTLGVDTLNAADTGVDYGGVLGATTLQLQVKGLAATNITWRLYVGAIYTYT